MADKVLGVAVIGLGIGESHARAYHSDGRCRLRWLIDHNLDKAATLARELETNIGSNFDTVLADQSVQIVSIASYDNDHASQVIQALVAGKHVFVEKPLCQNWNELRQIYQLWSKNKGRLKLGSNLVLRAAPMYQWLKKRIREGDFGAIYSFDGEYLYGRLEKITHGWRSKTPSYSVIEGGGIHMIDLLLWLIGELPEAVVSMGNCISTEGSSFTNYDFVAATMQMKSGLISRIVANFGCVHRHQHVVRIYGTKGTFIYDDTGARTFWTREESAKPALVNLAALPANKGDLINSFVTSVWKDEDISKQTEDMFNGLCISIACDRAVKTKRVVRVAYL